MIRGKYAWIMFRKRPLAARNPFHGTFRKYSFCGFETVSKG